MNEQWFQLWMTSPIGEQFAGWVWQNQPQAMALAASLSSSGAAAAGVTWQVRDQHGTPVIPGGFQPPPGIEIPDWLKNLGGMVGGACCAPCAAGRSGCR